MTNESDCEIKRLKQWVNDLQSGMYVNCVYCGHRYGRDGEVPVSMAGVLKRHIAHCPEHPMSKLVATLKAASHALRSYQYGNSATDLAQEMADSIDAVIEETVSLDNGSQGG
jgi:histidinol-phosphate/aromatic aminotransferase/cobyric acid decarboxylase-like protein